MTGGGLGSALSMSRVMSLRVKTFIPLLIAGVAFALYLTLVWMPKSMVHEAEEYEEHLSRQLAILSESLVPLLLENQLANVHENLNALMAKNEYWLALDLRDAQGKLLYPMRSDSQRVAGEDVRLLKSSASYLDALIADVSLWVDFTPYLALRRQEHQDLIASLLLFAGVFVVTLGLVVELFMRRPIHQLAQAATVLARGDFDTPLPAAGGDEVGDLTRAFADMRVAINHSQARLMAEIESHEQAREALEQERRRATVTLHSIADAVIVVDAMGQVESMNAVAERLTGWTLAEARSLPLEQVLQVTSESGTSFAQHALRQVLEEERYAAGTDDGSLRNRDGEILTIEMSLAPIRQLDHTQGAVLVFRDVTQLRQSHREALHERDEVLRTVVASAPMMLFALDKAGKVMIAEGSELKRLLSKNEQSGAASQSRSLETLPAVQRDITRALAGEAFWSTMSMHGLVYECRYTPVFNTQGDITGSVAVALDITERKRAEDRLNYLAYYDALTSLPNRALFNDRLQLAMAEADRDGKRVAVMFLDLDRFKDINDTLGHEAGDLLLREVADRLLHSVRKVDTVARLGGDEFTLILPAIAGLSDVTVIVEKVVQRFTAPFGVAGRSLHVTPSIGITLYPSDADKQEVLLKNADIAMYEAKNQGRNNYQFYSHEMSANAYSRMTLESHLRQALERNEFTLHYQPQVELRSGRIIGVEALLRWQQPTLGYIAPEKFIPLAEEIGVIESIGAWVLNEACRQCKAWQEEEFPVINLAVNLSIRQFREKRFSQSVLDTLARHDLDPRALELELTESLLAHDVVTMGASMQELGTAGVRFAIDDFGTGYSALGYLKRYPIDALKIDKTFIHDVHRSTDTATIANAIVALGRSLQLKVVAEGVETRAQWEFLCDTTCDAVQGHLVSRPLPAAEISSLMREGRCFSPATLQWSVA